MLNMKPNLHDATQPQFADNSHPKTQRQSEVTNAKNTKSNSSLGILPTRPSHPKEMTVQARRAYDNSPIQIDLAFTDIIGKGTFGQIECALLTLREDSEKSSKDTLKVAVKQVLQDPRYKNRELSIMQKLRNHSNIVSFYYYYYSTSKGSGSNSRATRNTASNETSSDVNIFLHLVLECFPESLCDLIFRYSQQSHSIPNMTVKLFTYQMLKALGYLHSHSICHRDIKSSNLLVNESTLVLKVCDFGSAKEMTPGSTNVSYISSRYYRAPELLFGAQSYTCAIDTWSAGCVLAEMLRLYCLFAGTDSVDQLVKVIRVLGTPTVEEILSMNPLYDTYNFPNVDACPVQIYFPIHTPMDMLNLMNQMLVYNPTKRITPRNALSHDCFKEIRNIGEKGMLPNRIPMPPHIFDPDPEKPESGKKDEERKNSSTSKTSASTNNSNQSKETVSKAKTPPVAKETVSKKNSVDNRAEKGTIDAEINEPQPQQPVSAKKEDSATPFI